MEDTMDEIRNQMNFASQVSNSIAQTVGFGLEIDEVIYILF